jgi:hypothetical protein
LGIGGHFGTQLFADEVMGPALDGVMDTGIRYLRVPVQWKWIEPSNQSPPAYLWGSMDQAVSRMASRGIRPVAVLYTRPDWASSDGCGPIDRVPMGRYTDYISAIVERYDGDGYLDAPGSPRMRHWEVENEQDFNPDPAVTRGSPSFGSCFGGSRAGDYAEHLRATYLAAKAADPGATVIFGGLSYERFYNRPAKGFDGPFDYHFAGNVLDALHAAHGQEPAWPFFDWLAIHFYDDFRNNWDGSDTFQQGLRAKLSNFRDNQMVEPGVYDLRDHPIALTEGGLSSAPADAWTDRSEELQAHYPGRVVSRGLAENLPLILWFMGKDRFTGDCSDIYAWQTFGLLRSSQVAEQAAACQNNPLQGYPEGHDNAPKPAQLALKTAQTELGGSVLEAELGASVTGNRRIEAYRFRHESGQRVIVAFTDNGERIGRRGSREILTQLNLTSSMLPGWTGHVTIVDHLGVEGVQSGDSIRIDLRQAAVYIRVAPAGAAVLSEKAEPVAGSHRVETSPKAGSDWRRYGWR